MKIIKIDLSEVKNDPFLQNIPKNGFLNRLKHSLNLRKIKGYYCIELMDAAYLYRKLKSGESKKHLIHTAIEYVFGSSFLYKFFSDSKAINTSIYGYLQQNIIEYRKTSYLYHFTPISNIDSIMKNGIKKSSTGFVFLTNISNYEGFLRWKTLMNNQSMKFCILRVNAKKLAKTHKLYFYKQNVIVADYVEPEFISIV